MRHLNINIGSHGTPTTVSEMRRQLARVLSQLDGSKPVTFSFSAVIENYDPLGAPYGITKGGLAGYAERMNATPMQISQEESDTDPYRAFASKVWGEEIARSTTKNPALGAPYRFGKLPGAC